MVMHVVTNHLPASNPPATWSSAVREVRALSTPGVSLQPSATGMGFGPHSLHAPQPSPREPGSSHGTADVGCLPACLISPSYNIITASGECMQHSPDAARPSPSRQLRDARGCCGRAPHSWCVKRSRHGMGCGSLNAMVQKDLPTQLTDPKTAEGLSLKQ